MSVSTISQAVEPLPPAATGLAAYERFSADPDLLALPVVDAAHKPVGLLARNAFFLKFADRFGRALFEKRPVTFVMDPQPLVVEADRPIATLSAHIAAKRPGALLDGFIIVEGGRYLGVGHGVSLLRAVTMQHAGLARRLTLAMEIADAAAWEIDFELGEVLGGADTARIYGRAITMADLEPDSASFPCHPDDRARVLAAVRTPGGRLAHRIPRPDGSLGWVEACWRTTYNGAGQIRRIVLMSRDVTEQRAQEKAFSDTLRQAEAGLSAKSALLEEVASALDRPDLRAPLQRAPATAETGADADLMGRLSRILQELAARDAALGEAVRALRRAERDAQAANHAKSQFLANMSHELRTPLNAIIGYSEILIEDTGQAGGPDQSLGDLRRILAAGRRLLHLINEVLDLAKIEAGKMDLVAARVDVRALVEEAAATVAPQAQRQGDALETACAPDLGFARTDSQKLTQCLLNLLSNAVKFTRNGRVRLHASRQGPDLCFEVTDTGIGMSTAQIGRLFQPFVQADASTTREYGGTGLGLAITQRLAGLLGGEVRVESAPGVGSTFTLRIPAILPTPDTCEEDLWLVATPAARAAMEAVG